MSAITPAPASLGAATPPPVAGPKPWKWTREQYFHAAGLGYFGDRRVQLIFGEVVEMPKQNWPHVAGCRKTADQLRAVFATVGWVSEQSPFPFSDSAPEPDVWVVPGRFEDCTDHPTSALLIVEVSDTTLNYDLTTKAELYATAGIADYWVLDVVNRELHIFRDPVPLPAGLGATAYRTHLALAPTDHLSPLAAPQASILVSDLLP
jgi:Uma2 family endonuclease